MGQRSLPRLDLLPTLTSNDLVLAALVIVRLNPSNILRSKRDSPGSRMNTGIRLLVSCHASTSLCTDSGSRSNFATILLFSFSWFLKRRGTHAIRCSAYTAGTLSFNEYANCLALLTDELLV